MHSIIALISFLEPVCSVRDYHRPNLGYRADHGSDDED
jgi:hypothetical protein